MVQFQSILYKIVSTLMFLTRSIPLEEYIFQIPLEPVVAKLVAVHSDRKEQLQNCGALVYNMRMPDNRTQVKSHPPLIGTMFTDDRATVVLGSYGGVILNELGMSMEMVGPGDIIRLQHAGAS